MIRQVYFITLTLVALALGGCRQRPVPHVTSSVYTLDQGFGYTIKVNGKPYINQQYIPALPGQLRFCDSTDARNVCNLVVKKITGGKTPFITPEELKKLKIKVKC